MNILWSASYSAIKYSLDFFAPLQLLVVRFLLSAIVLAFFSYKYGFRQPKKIILRCALLGLVIAVAHGLGALGINLSHATDGAIIYAMEPISAIIFARIILKERMDARKLLALIIALTGFAILSDVLSKDIFHNLILIGNFIMLIGIIVDGLYSPVAKPIVEKCPARIAMMYTLFFASIYLVPFALLSPVKHQTFTWQVGASIFYLTVICTAIGWTFWMFCLKKFPVNAIALTVFLQPVFGPIISHFTLGEQISSRTWFGGGVILCGVLVAMIKRKPRETELVTEVGF